MPELPEVETVRTALEKKLKNKVIKDINILYPNIFEGQNINVISDKIKNNKINSIKRRGKWLLFELDDYYLLSHLRMEGKFFVKKSNEFVNYHEHVIISFIDGTDLRYHDTRKFGKMQVVKKEDLYNVPAIKKQGIEANSEDLTKEYLYEKIKKKRTNIKTLLLDQTIISGLGNIYASEVLFASHINPERCGNSLSLDDVENIVKASKAIINKAIEEGGTTIRSYTSSLGVTGRFQQYLYVYNRENLPCRICGEKISCTIIGGRSTYYCSRCQK